MGSERAGKRKHLFLCFACSIIISLATDGCVHFHVNQEGEEDLARARSLMHQGAFEASLRESQEVLTRYPQSQGDRALFQMGLIYLQPQNPNVDYQKSLGYFQRLEREFPRSDLRSDAEIWILILQKISEKDKDIEILKKIWNQKAKELAEKQEDVKKLRHQVESLQNQTKSLEHQTGELEQQINDLQKQIKQLKEIDLGIEEKRRDALQK
jgi:peptidoglycan hydrolase CwlO-like protein